MKKTSSLGERVKKIDDSKKVNPLDLSSDQDLSIALMNLISLEEHFVFSGAKTKKTGYYDFVNTIHEIRQRLMTQIMGNTAKSDDAVWCMSAHLLAASMRVIEVGTKALSAGNASGAYQLFDQAYELYSLFWGINMGLIDLAGVNEVAPEIYDFATAGCPLTLEKNDSKQPKISKKSTTKPQSMTQKLGAWVKNAVNCCIE